MLNTDTCLDKIEKGVLEGLKFKVVSGKVLEAFTEEMAVG